MEAKVTRVDGSNVYIERNDGLITKVNVSIFSEVDQSYIKQWELSALFKNRVCDVSLSRQLSDHSDYENDGIHYDTCNMHFDVIISNNSREHRFEDLKIEYLIFKFEDKISARKRCEGTIQRIRGSMEPISINVQDELRISTEKFEMLEARRVQVAEGMDEARKTSKDTIRGIWIKIYIGEHLVYEISKPGNIESREAWE